MSEPVPILVAHRGYPARFPENTLVGITAAVAAGACYVEFDVQLSKDGVPVLLHDQDLVRTAGTDVSVYEKTVAQLKKYSVGEAARFDDRFKEVKIPALYEAVEFLQDNPGVQAFVEIKRGSLQRFGHEKVMDVVWQAVLPVRDQVVIISFDSGAVEATQRRGICRTGWAIRSMDRRSQQQAVRLAPDFLFFSQRLLPPPEQELWPASWQWVIYAINDPEQALQLTRRGINLVETDAIGEMLAHTLLGQKKCHHDK